MDAMTQPEGGPARGKTEDQFTKTVEKYTAAVPSSAYLAVAIGAMGLSLLFQATGRGKWGNFIGQWAPTWLITRSIQQTGEAGGSRPLRSCRAVAWRVRPQPRRMRYFDRADYRRPLLELPASGQSHE